MRRRGYSLIELILVVALLAILAGVVWTARSNTLQTRALNRDGGVVLSMLREARSMAAVRSTWTKVVIDAELRQVRLEVLEDPLDNPHGYTAPKGARGEAATFGEDVTVTVTNRDTGATAAEIVFYQDGRADPVDVELSHPRVQERLLIRVNRLTGIGQMSEVLP
jgi:prepilin-type N-terminal cleavage/methylation domain-containing protein